MLQKVVFLDRDGVINQDSPLYIKNWSEFRFLPGSLAALTRFYDRGYSAIVVTNQSMLGRGISTIENLEEMHEKMKNAVSEHGGEIQDIFFCPHRPEENCDCRKPKPGMVLAAKRKYDIDLSSVYMVGDSAKDIECAGNAGIRYTVLVKTGNGIGAQSVLADKGIAPDYIADDLLDASEWILGHTSR